MEPREQARFDKLYQSYINELILQGKSPKTIDSYSRYLRQITEYFDTCPDHLLATQLKGYFLHLATRKIMERGQRHTLRDTVFIQISFRPPLGLGKYR